MENPAETGSDPLAGRRLLLILPAYNESAAIGRTLRLLRELAIPHDVLVVNDGSADATAEIARGCGARVLDLACNLGVGGAMQAGYQYAAENGYDLAVQFDADGQHRVNQVQTLLDPVLADRADLAVGSRYLGGRTYRFSLERLLGSRLLAALASLITRRKITDPTSGFRAAGKRAIRFFSRHYPQAYLGDTVEALVQLTRHGMTVEEVPVRMAQRQGGASSVGFVVGLVHTLRIILAVLVDCIERKLEDDSAPPTEGNET